MKLAVLFPGVGYHIDKPLLYYAKELAARLGYELAEAKYGELPSGIRGSAEKMRAAFEAALAGATESLRGVEWEKYDELLFIAKSIGTAVSAETAKRLGLRTRNIYYTPVRETFLFPLQEGIAFHGTADAWVTTREVQEGCAACGIKLFVTEGANHSMETEDALENIRILGGIMEKTAAYIKGEAAEGGRWEEQ
ncbi:MAG: alpha/beta hydrolase [Lachnospiraceae bacterium]|nr:alpha/beta hydrolase [Lachnospiraceae bacterium]